MNAPRFMRAKFFRGKVPWVKCAVCQRPCQEIVTWQDSDTFKPAVFRYEFRCHGSVERTELEVELVEEAEQILLGEVFVAEAARMLPATEEA